MKIKPKEFQIIPNAIGNLLLEGRSTENQVASMELDKEAFELLTLAIFQTLLTVPENHPFFELRQLLSVSNVKVECQHQHLLTISPSLGVGVDLHSTIEHEQVLALRNQIDAALSQYQRPVAQ